MHGFEGHSEWQHSVILSFRSPPWIHYACLCSISALPLLFLSTAYLYLTTKLLKNTAHLFLLEKQLLFMHAISVLGKAQYLFWKNLKRIGLSDLLDLIGFPGLAQDLSVLKDVWQILPHLPGKIAHAFSFLPPSFTPWTWKWREEWNQQRKVEEKKVVG